MGKTSRWFRALLGAKKLSDPSPASDYPRPNNEKKKWGFVRSFNGNDRNIGGTRCSFTEASSSGPYVEAIDANKHAIAVAAATAAVAEAALAAAQAAAEVVRLTSGGGSRPPSKAYVRGSDRRRELAAVRIQSAFRAYLARRALRALKGLVRLQALVRGRIVRKQSADMLRRLQAMARIQARACANRAYVSEPSHSSSKSSQSCKPWSQSKSKIKDIVELERTPLGSNWLDRWMEECSWNNQGDTSLKTVHADDERSDKILEVDTWKPHLNTKQSDRNFRTTEWNYNDQGFTTFDPLSTHSTKSRKQNPSISSGEALYLASLKFPTEVDQAAAWNSENSPQVCSASSRPGRSGRRGPLTPARSECSRSVFSDYLGYPNYMVNTESSLAKVRSQSAPRQRMQVETLGSKKRFVRGFWDSETISERGSALHDNFSTKAYSGSGYSDRLGIPVQGNSTASYTSGYGCRF